MKILIPEFKSFDDKFRFMRERKETMIGMKKSSIKHADGVGCFFIENKENEQTIVVKEVNRKLENTDTNLIYIEPVINTTKFMDSHDDVHFDNIWNRSVKSKRQRILNREHKGHDFNYVIADDISPRVETIKWTDLGETFTGSTQALIYPTNILKERNEFMFNQYIKGWVKNHSVEMQYVQLALAMKSDNMNDKKERDVWEQYYALIVNKDVPDELGYFWAVTEAKELGGAAVPRGSNSATPTYMIETSDTDKTTRNDDTEQSTQKNGFSFILGN